MSGRRHILTFHGVGEPSRPLDRGEDRVWLSTERFRRLLDVLGGQAGARITFDDGNASDAEIAGPELEARGLTATFFVVAGRLGQPGFLRWEHLDRLLDRGMEVGSHGMRHRPWRGLGSTEREEEIRESKELLETRLGRPVDEAACPFGAYDRRVLSAARRAGYARLLTSDGGAANPRAWLQSRTTVMSGDDELSLERLLSGEHPTARARRAAKCVVKALR